MFTTDGIRSRPAYSLTMTVSLYCSAMTAVSIMTGAAGRTNVLRTAATQFTIGAVAFALQLPARLAA